MSPSPGLVAGSACSFGCLPPLANGTDTCPPHRRVTLGYGSQVQMVKQAPQGQDCVLICIFLCRLLAMFTISVVSVTIPAALTNRTTAVLLATAFGYLLSQDIFSNLKALACLLNSKCKPITRLSHHFWKGVFSKTFSSYCHIDFHPISGLKSFLLHVTVTTLEGALLLSSGLVIVYFTFNTSGSGANLATTSVGSVLIGLFIVITLSDTFQGVYFLRLFRNPLFPKCSGSTKKFKRCRKYLSYLTIPRRLALAYGKSEIEELSCH